MKLPDDLRPGVEELPGESPLFTPRVLSGMDPSGRMHLGNYLGAVKQHIELQHEYPGEAYYLLANYHALTQLADRSRLREDSWHMALDYLAMGVDPVKATFYRQSDVPQTCELLWILVCLMPHADLVRMKQFQHITWQGQSTSVGLLLYPALMAADILGVRATIVPVGEDQVEYIGIAREAAKRFNGIFECQVFPEPVACLNEASMVPGLDGKEMHRINRNIIPLFAPEEETRQRIMMIRPAVSTLAGAACSPEEPLLQWFHLLGGPEAAEEWRHAIPRRGGYQQAQKAFFMALMRHLEPFRQRRTELERDLDTLEDMLRDGARRAREQVAETIGTVRELVGIGAYRRALRW